jgi:C-terminal processing protease CtpA/Prc
VNVREDSPGATAGLKKDDVIVSINRKPASTYTLQSINELLKSEDGKKILFEVNSNGKYVKTTLQLKSIL